MSGNVPDGARHAKPEQPTVFAEPSFPAGALSPNGSSTGLEEAIDFSAAQDHFQKLQTQDLNRQGGDPTARVGSIGPKVHKAKVQTPAQTATQPNTQDAVLPNAQASGSATPSKSSTAPSSKKPDTMSTDKSHMSAAQEFQLIQDALAERARLTESVQRNLELSLAAYHAEKAAALEKVFQDRQRCKEWITDSTSASAEPIDLKLDLGRQVSGFWKTSRPTVAVTRQRQQVINAIQHAIDRRWPGQKLHVAAFGSSVTGLVTDSSDLDLVLLDPTRPHGVGTPEDLIRPSSRPVRYRDNLPDWYRVYNIADAIRDTNAFTEVVAISGANVPIVKMVHKASKLPADLNINERFGLFNSRLISAYANLQPEIVRPLTFFLKHWFSARGINDPSGKSGAMSFSSYTIALMIIQFLQVQGLLPNLQDTRLVESLSIPSAYLWSRPRQIGYRRGDARPQIIPPQKYDVTFATTSGIDHRQMIIDVTTQSEEQTTDDIFNRKLGDLLLGFFQYYEQFDLREQVISIASGAPVNLQSESERSDLQYLAMAESNTLEGTLRSLQLDVTQNTQSETSDKWTNPALAKFVQPADWHKDEIIVQDPFITNRNTSRNIKSMVVFQFHAELRRANLMLERHTTRSGNGIPLISDLMIPSSIVPPVDYVEDAEESAIRSVSDNPSGPAEEDLAREKETEEQIEEEVRRKTIKTFKKNEKTRIRRSAQRREMRRVEKAGSQPPDEDVPAPATPQQEFKSEKQSDSWMPSDASAAFSFRMASPGRTLE